MWFRVRWAVAVFAVLTVLFALGSTALVTTAAVDASGARRMESETILVKFKSSTARASSISDEGDDEDATLDDDDNVVVVRLRKGRSVADALTRYGSREGVEYAEPNFVATAQLANPTDSSFGSQWALTRIAAPAGWTAYPGAYVNSGGPSVAVLDTGVQTTHPDLDSHVLSAQGATCTSGTCSASAADDDHGHGTHVAGIVAAETNNSQGVAGVSFTSSIIPVKVLNGSGSGSYASITAGIQWAVARGAKVINLSLGGTDYSQALCDAASSAISAGVMVVAAAGNAASGVAFYPAACPGVVGVASTDSGDVASSFSNFGSPNVFVSAPGGSILSTYTGSAYATMSGTSMASPHVAGLAALLFGKTPGSTVASVRTVLATTSDKIGGVVYGGDPYGTCAGCTWSSGYGYGRINVQRALATTATPPVAPTITSGPSASTTATTASFVFSHSQAGVTFRCRLDGAAYASCSSPLSYASLAVGPHTFYVLARDASGLEGAPASRTWTITAPVPAAPGSIVVAFPTSVTVASGTATGGTAVSLAADDGQYYTVRAATSGSSPRWYATFSNVPASLTSLKVTYNGSNTASCTQSIALYDWSAGGYEVIASAAVGTTDITFANIAATGSLARFRSSSGQVRVRLRCSTASNAQISSRGDFMQIEYAIP